MYIWDRVLGLISVFRYAYNVSQIFSKEVILADETSITYSLGK